MSHRSANATIKGYFYQFDHTIVQILGAPAPDATITVEGVEDVDVATAGENSLIQCKYYESTEYNHSVIKDAVIQMLRHYSKNSLDLKQRTKYRIYGHFKSGQDKLSHPIDLSFLKKHFLTFTENKKRHEVHTELSLSDSDLSQFLDRLTIDLFGKSYENQQKQVEALLESNICEANGTDVKEFYYPLAIHVIQGLSVELKDENRTVRKDDFLKKISKKDVIFSSWLELKFGLEYYAKSVRKKYFYSASTKLAPAARIFVFSLGVSLDMTKFTSLLIELGRRYSHKEHRRTPSQDRFCPYVFIPDATCEEIIELKTRLTGAGVKILDGYPFCGAEFSPALLATLPSKDNPYTIKFIPSAKGLLELTSEIKNTPVEVFEFYRHSPSAGINMPRTIPHNIIRAESIDLIKEMTI